MSPKRKKQTLRLHADPRKIRRVWTRKPSTRVKPSTRRERLQKIREREAREG